MEKSLKKEVWEKKLIEIRNNKTIKNCLFFLLLCIVFNNDLHELFIINNIIIYTNTNNVFDQS